jgi:hypothetical protein
MIGAVDTILYTTILRNKAPNQEKERAGESMLFNYSRVIHWVLRRGFSHTVHPHSSCFMFHHVKESHTGYFRHDESIQTIPPFSNTILAFFGCQVCSAAMHWRCQAL